MKKLFTRAKQLFFDKKKLIIEVIKFGIIGVINTLLDWTLFNILQPHIGDKLAYVILYLLLTFNGFYWNKVWTFHRKGFKLIELIKYYGVYSVALVLRLSMAGLFQMLFGMNEKIAYYPATVICIFLQFIGQRFFAFRNKPQKEPQNED